MSKLKVLGLMAVAFFTAVGLYSCKDDDDTVVEPFGKPSTVLSSVYDDKGFDGDPAVIEAIEKQISDELEAFAKADTLNLTENDAVSNFNKQMESIAQKYANGNNLIPADYTVFVDIDLTFAGNTIRQCNFSITNSKAEYQVVNTSVAYTMEVTAVNIEKAPDYMPADMKIEFGDLIQGWPVYGVTNSVALEKFDSSVAEQLKNLEYLQEEIADTARFEIQYSLSYNGGVTLKNKWVSLTKSKIELMK